MYKHATSKDAFEQYQFNTELVSTVVKDECRILHLSNDHLKTIMMNIDKSIRNGLGRETHSSSVVKCYSTYVHDLPNGSEKGKYLALDLGGTNFRILLITLDPLSKFHMEFETFKVPEYIQTGSGTKLFDHIAKCLASFVKKYEHKIGTQVLPLGFTFSFPLRQEGLTKGYLKNWTKGFNCTGVVDEDVVTLLQEAIHRRQDVKIAICGILNDTTGTLISCAWKQSNTKIGLIVGTGCNACYIEQIKNVELFDGDHSQQQVIINTEWGALGDDGTLDDIITSYDQEIDKDSLNPGKQRFEKLISGMYLGEIVRKMIVNFAHKNYLFNGFLSEQMMTQGSFETAIVSKIESDDITYGKTYNALCNMGIKNATKIDCANVRYICESVSKRSAYLVSAGLAALLNKIDSKNTTIGIDGSVYRYHPYFEHHMTNMTKILTKPNIKFKLMLSEDGSGCGAALVAAIAVRDKLF